jgi:hypothetical protein
MLRGAHTPRGGGAVSHTAFERIKTFLFANLPSVGNAYAVQPFAMQCAEQHKTSVGKADVRS